MVGFLLTLGLFAPPAAAGTPAPAPASVDARLSEIFDDEPPPTAAAPADAAATGPGVAPSPAEPVPVDFTPVELTPVGPPPMADSGPGVTPITDPSLAGPGPGEPPAQPEGADPTPEQLEAARANTPTLPPPKAWADIPVRWRIEFMVAGGTSSARHDTYSFFDDDDNRLSNSVVELRADAKLAGPFFLGGGLAYRYGETEHGSVFALGRTTLKLHEPRGFMRFAYEPVQGIDVYAHVGGGVSIVDYTTDFDTYTDNRSFAFVGDGLLGVMASLPKRWLPRRGSSRVTGGLDLGMGYSFRTPINIEPSPELDDDPIKTTSAQLGKLRASGFTWRFGVFVRFM